MSRACGTGIEAMHVECRQALVYLETGLGLDTWANSYKFEGSEAVDSADA